MNPRFHWQTQRLDFPTIEDWHSFAVAHGIAPDFILGPGAKRVDQALTSLVMADDGDICAIALLFTKTREVGLWVAASQRRQGYGRQVLSNLLAQNRGHLYGSVHQDNSCAAAMEHLLLTSGFHDIGMALGQRIWRWLPTG